MASGNFLKTNWEATKINLTYILIIFIIQIYSFNIPSDYISICNENAIIYSNFIFILLIDIVIILAMSIYSMKERVIMCLTDS